MKKLLFTSAAATVIAISLAAPVVAGTRIPAQFVGAWCGQTNDDVPFKRSHCPGEGTKLGEVIVTPYEWTIAPRSYRVISVTKIGNGDFVVKTRRVGSGEIYNNIFSLQFGELLIR